MEYKSFTARDTLTDTVSKAGKARSLSILSFFDFLLYTEYFENEFSLSI
ncbi:hypothetical protein [Leptospira gomenensis]|nr:hypothetical protein [Leptospira gomenensis]